MYCKLFSDDFCAFMFNFFFSTNHLIYFFELLFYWIFLLWNLVFLVNTCICDNGAKCKFNHPKEKGGYQKIYEQKGDGDSSITEGI